MLINSGVILLKYWFSVSSQEQVHSRPAYGRHVVQASSNLPGCLPNHCSWRHTALKKTDE
jgi:hypothetical protein